MLNCHKCKTTFDNYRVFIDHIPSCSQHVTVSNPSSFTIILPKLARKRFIESLQICCYECTVYLPLSPVDDYLVCSSCGTKHDLSISRNLNSRLTYTPPDQLGLFGGAP